MYFINKIGLNPKPEGQLLQMDSAYTDLGKHRVLCSEVKMCYCDR